MPDAELSPDQADLALLREAARAAGEIAMRYFKQSPEVWLKGGSSPVSAADYAVDKFLRESLMAARPDYGWLSEETADNDARLSARRTFVVDPIDGTRAFLDGRATWCVSVAVVEGGISRCGVLDCPAKNSILWAAEVVCRGDVLVVLDDVSVVGRRSLRRIDGGSRGRDIASGILLTEERTSDEQCSGSLPPTCALTTSRESERTWSTTTAWSLASTPRCTDSRISAARRSMTGRATARTLRLRW